MNRIIKFKNAPTIIATASIGGKKEGESNLSDFIDKNGKN